jgi:hypothetical protein
MKRLTSLALFAFAGLLGAGSALAQDCPVRATMPFDFTVGNKSLPPGAYTITRVTDDSIAIRNRDGNVSILTPAYADSNQSKNAGELVFDKYDGQYFLREILGGSFAMNVNLPLPKSEKVRSREFLAGGQNHVIVAMK